eukprot:scaffold5042_cov37-Phaeocystis_antarctica.AAC.3
MVLLRSRNLSRGRAPRPRAAPNAEANAKASASWNIPGKLRSRRTTAGSAPAPSPAASRSAPAAQVAPLRCNSSSTGSTEPSEPRVARSTAVKNKNISSIDAWLCRRISLTVMPNSGSAAVMLLLAHVVRFAAVSCLASRSSLQLRSPSLTHSAAATAWSARSCCRSACVGASSPWQALLRATATHGSSTLRSPSKMTPSASSLRARSSIAPAAPVAVASPPPSPAAQVAVMSPPPSRRAPRAAVGGGMNGQELHRGTLENLTEPCLFPGDLHAHFIRPAAHDFQHSAS